MQLPLLFDNQEIVDAARFGHGKFVLAGNAVQGHLSLQVATLVIEIFAIGLQHVVGRDLLQQPQKLLNARTRLMKVFRKKFQACFLKEVVRIKDGGAGFWPSLARMTVKKCFAYLSNNSWAAAESPARAFASNSSSSWATKRAFLLCRCSMAVIH